MVRILVVPISIIAIIAISVFGYYRLKLGFNPFSPKPFKTYENCLRSIAETIPRYPNAEKWNVTSHSQSVGLDGSASASVQFFTEDDEETVFNYYKKKLSEDGWQERDNSVYLAELPEKASHSLTFQKNGVIALSSPEGHPDAASLNGPAETEIVRRDYFFRVPYCKAFK